MDITLRYAMSEYNKWVGAIWGATSRGHIMPPDAWVMLGELNVAMRAWIGKDILDMHFMEFNEAIKELSR